MTTIAHPRLEDVSLDTALKALADPMRREIIRRLAAEGDLDCECCMSSNAAPKSTRTLHLKALREAGLVETRKEGRRMLNRLRRREFEARFPKLLSAVLRADG